MRLSIVVKEFYAMSARIWPLLPKLLDDRLEAMIDIIKAIYIISLPHTMHQQCPIRFKEYGKKSFKLMIFSSYHSTWTFTFIQPDIFLPICLRYIQVSSPVTISQSRRSPLWSFFKFSLQNWTRSSFC